MHDPYPYPAVFGSRYFVTLRYSISAVSNCALAAAMFVFPQYRDILFLYFIAAVVETGIIAVVDAGLHLFRRKDCNRDIILHFLLLDIIYLLVLDAITRVYFQIQFSPIFLIPIVTIQGAYFYRSITPAFRILPNALWITVYFLATMIATDAVLYFRYAHSNIVFFLVKILIIISAHAFVTRLYSLLLSYIAERLEENTRLNERLIGSMKFIVSGEIFSVMLNDVKSMMHTIVTSLNSIRAHAAQPAEGERFYPIIGQSVTDTETIVDQFLSYIKLDPQFVETVDVREITREALAFIRISRKRTALIEFVTSGIDEGDPIYLTASKYRLLSVFLNLITNAIDTPAMQSSAEKRVRVSVAAGECIEVTVEDNGPGISAEDITDMFSLYSKKKTGLGLYFVHEYIVGTLGGTVTAESVPNERTVFTVRIPHVGK
ncbi:MAG: HAMP domain-containing sensor histidine kinase [Spirochaetota bacterium]